jgi:hypothetical protein
VHTSLRVIGVLSDPVVSVVLGLGFRAIAIAWDGNGIQDRGAAVVAMSTGSSKSMWQDDRHADYQL